MNKKKWYQSKTVWLAIAQAVVGVCAAVITQDPTIGWAVGLKSVLDIVIRIFGTAQTIV